MLLLLLLLLYFLNCYYCYCCYIVDNNDVDGGCCDHDHNEGRKEGNGLFNDALNTLYLRLYGGKYCKGPLR